MQVTHGRGWIVSLSAAIALPAATLQTKGYARGAYVALPPTCPLTSARFSLISPEPDR